MTLSNTSTITQSDLQGMNATALTNLSALNNVSPTQIVTNYTFQNVISTTVLDERSINSIVPDDQIIREIAVTASNVNSGTITVTVDTGFLLEPISITFTASASPAQDKAPRYYNVNLISKKLTTDPTPITRGQQVLNYNAPLLITVSNTASSTPNKIDVALVLESKIRRK